jgi:DeoR family transcriptional regulator of aga operon
MTTSSSEDAADEPRSDRSDRLHAVLDLVASRGQLSVVEAAQVLEVSEATVRRDFGSLAAQQLVQRTHGGVIATQVSYDLPARYRASDETTGAKARIAARASQMVGIGDTVALNGGTTTSLVARHIAARHDLAESAVQPTLTIVTNALNIAAEMVLRPYIRTVSLGGVARPHSYEVVGPLAEQTLAELWFDHVFLGVAGLDPTAGASCGHDGEASINALMVEHAREVTVVCGSEKLSRRAFARICATSSISRIVTGVDADERLVDSFRSEGVEVITV